MADSAILQSSVQWVKKRLRGPWSALGMGSALTTVTLKDIAGSFKLFDSQIRTKLLLSFLSIRPKDLPELKPELNRLLSIAESDADEWVRAVRVVVKNYVETASLQGLTAAADSGAAVGPVQLAQTIGAFRQAGQVVARAEAELGPGGGTRYLPLGAMFLNTTALPDDYDVASQPANLHFTVKQMPPRLTHNSSAHVGTSINAVNAGASSSVSKWGGAAGGLKQKSGSGFGMGRRAILDRRSSLVAMASPSEPAPAAGRSRREMLMNKATAATGRGVVTLDHADLPTMVKDRKRKAAAIEEEARVNAAVAQAEATAEAERAAATASAAPPKLDLADAYGLGSTGLDNPYGAAVSSVTEQATATMSMGYGLGIGLPDQRMDQPAATQQLPLPLPRQPLPPTQAIPAAAAAAALESGPAVSEATLASIFEQSNKLKPADRQLVAAFVGDENAVPVDGRNVVQVVLHEQRTPGTTPQTVDVERLVFEMTFAPHGWRRLRQRRTMKLKT